MTAGVLTGGAEGVGGGGAGGGSGQGTLPYAVHRRDFYDAIVGVMLVIFVFFFFVGERIESLPIPIRIEDFMFLLLIPLGYRYLIRPKTKLFYWIVAYFGISFIPYTAAMIAGQYDLSVYPIIMVKELQYFYIAYLITQNRSWWVLGAVDALALLIIGNGVRQIIQGEIDYYGIGTLGNYLAPSIAGALFLFSTIWLHIRSKLLPSAPLRWVAMIVVSLGAACAIATVSRSTIIAVIAYFAAYLFVARKLVFPAFVAGLALSPMAIQALALSLGVGYGLIARRIIGRVQAIESAAGYRAEKWEYYLASFQPMDYVFGRGKGYPNAVDQTFGLGVDSQYVRLVLETGVIGLAIVGGILWIMLKTIRKRGGELHHALAVVVAMMVMSIPLEAMQLSKSGGFFWLIMFYLLCCQRRVQSAIA
jgi:hypothetical protein